MELKPMLIKLGFVGAAVGLYALSTVPGVVDVAGEIKLLAGFVVGLVFPQYGAKVAK